MTFDHVENITISLRLRYLCRKTAYIKKMLNHVYPYITIIMSIISIIDGFYCVIVLFL